MKLGLITAMLNATVPSKKPLHCMQNLRLKEIQCRYPVLISQTIAMLQIAKSPETSDSVVHACFETARALFGDLTFGYSYNTLALVQSSHEHGPRSRTGRGRSSH